MPAPVRAFADGVMGGGSRQAAKRALYRAAGSLGVFRTLRWMNRRRIPILTYHDVVDGPLPPLLEASQLHLQADRLRQHLAYLTSRYRVIGLADLVHHLGAGSPPLPERALVLTFDDGYVGTLRLAGPILSELGLTATVFLPTDYVDAGGLFWWDELPALLSAAQGREAHADGWGTVDLRTAEGTAAAFGTGRDLLSAAPLPERSDRLGALASALEVTVDAALAERLRPASWAEWRSAPSCFEFGAHTAAHRRLDQVPVAQVEEDLRRCAARLHAELGVTPPIPFCYPEGYHTPEVRALLPEMGFGAAVTATETVDDDLADTDCDPFLLPRIGVASVMDPLLLAGNAAGFRRALRAVGAGVRS